MNDHDRPGPRLQAILDDLSVSAASGALAWLREGIALVTLAGAPEEPLAGRFAAALRRLGPDAFVPPGRRLRTGCGGIRLDAWTRGDAARVCLLMAAAGDARPGWEAMVRRLFRHGDESERASITRALCLLPAPCALLDLALEAGRANSLALYGALALDNPFPAACYEDHAFNQVVLKSLFNGLPVARIVGLRGRSNPELSRMCEEYRDERVAAGRDIPPDIWLALEPHASGRGLSLTLDALNDADPAHRYNAVVALSRRHGEPRIDRALAERLARETDPELRRLLESVCA